MDTEAEKIALNYADLAGDLAAIVEWCVTNSGTCLAVDPKRLAIAKKVLERARRIYNSAD